MEMPSAGQVVRNYPRGGGRHEHPIKAAKQAAFYRVFSVVRGKDRPCQWKFRGGGSTGWHRWASGKPERNAVPRKG